MNVSPIAEGAIAVVGLAGRFPKSRNAYEFWRNLREGAECIGVFTESELQAAGVSPALMADPNYVKAGAVLDDLEMFDAGFFGFSPKDAAIMDPQHRHFLECAWESLEDAGYAPANFRGAIGVYAGSGMNAYLIHNLLHNAALIDSAGLFLIRQTGNDKDVLATRVSYEFDLRGPSVNVQTACSSSLVAVHMACQSLLARECDMALAGGVTIEIPHVAGYLYREGEIQSQDGHCRAFDARSTGTVFGSGLGIVVLRRLEDALADGDRIRAVILGSAVNNDGARKIGYLAPSVDGQAAVIAEALQVAGVEAASISYVEAHGTGTRVGDPIEVAGLTKAFGAAGGKETCAIGSVKTNVGHLDAAAGVAGLIKTVLALEHREIPPSLHFEIPNPHIDFGNGPFFVNAHLRPWDSHAAPRRAGVTSLGIGGTNAHVVLEEAPDAPRARRPRPWELLTLSAKSETALNASAANLAAHLEQNPALPLADVALTCQMSRSVFAHRRAVVCRSAAEAAAGLRAGAARSGYREGRPVVFLFSGQGSQYVNMGRELYEEEPVFRETLDRCAQLLLPHLNLDLRAVLYPSEDAAGDAARQLLETRLTQPALFAVEYALAQLWMSWGIRPQAMAGHSIGEYVAACVAGVFSLEDALRIVAARGRLMQSLAPGAMSAVAAPEATVRALRPREVSIAAVNAPDQCVVSGPAGPVDALESELRAQGIASTRLKTSRAFHSAMMEPVLEEFREIVGGVSAKAPQIPYLSNVTGTWITPEQATDPSYWSGHIRSAVRFADMIEELFRDPRRLLLEIGPGATLASLARTHPARPAEVLTLHSLPHRSDPAPAYKILLHSLGQAWISGVQPDWQTFHSAHPACRVSLPSYPFERKRYWIEPDRTEPARSSQTADSVDRWFYHAAWKSEALITAAPAMDDKRWLVMADESLGDVVRARLLENGRGVTMVRPGDRFSRDANGDYRIAAASRSDYNLLLNDLAARDLLPECIVHLSALTAQDTGGLFSLLYLVQALGEREHTAVRIAAVSNQAANLWSATLAGAARTIVKEFPDMICRSLDVAETSVQAAQQIVRETQSDSQDILVRYRGADRLVQAIEPVPCPAAAPRLRDRGVYLITGGLGGLGLAIARRLASESRAKLVLLGRTPVPDPSERDAWLAGHDATDPVSLKIRGLREIEELGGETLALHADVRNEEEMRAALSAARERFGPLNGVIHAAGVLNDGLIQLKTAEGAARVLDPKVQGTLVLDRLLGDSALDFFILFSSISAMAPPVGQFDYASANAFLDAFAEARNGRGAKSCLSVNWARWRDAGMGAEQESGTVLASERVSCATHWLLDEHRLRGGAAIFPGTGYLDLVARSLWRDGRRDPIEFREVLFLSPLAIEANETWEVALRTRAEDSGRRFVVLARPAGEADWREHASGLVAIADQTERPALAIRSLRARCKEQRLNFLGTPTRQEDYFRFGPRWKCLRQIDCGRDEALAELELPEKFIADLDRTPLHPALFDLATGCSLFLIPQYAQAQLVSAYFPMSYERIRVWDRFPARVYSHVRARQGNSLFKEAVAFDITIADASGKAIVEIEGFSLRRVADVSAHSSQRRTHSPVATSAAISQDDGCAAFLRLLQWDRPEAGVIVSPEAPVLPLLPVRAAASSPPRGHDSTGWNDLERQIGKWWEELLGVETVELDQDFFDLGGQSLVAVRLVTKIKNTYSVTLGLSALFEARTIRQLAGLVRREQGRGQDTEPQWSSLVCIKPGGDLTPIYFISGLGGNVLNFHAVARYLGPSRPVYALQPPGLDGKRPFLRSVEEVAAHYIREIRSLQPTGPYYLTGYSFGGFVTFEMAQQLRRDGEEVGLVALLDTIEWHYWQRAKNSLGARNRLRVYRDRVQRVLFAPDGREYLKARAGARLRQALHRGANAVGRAEMVDLTHIEDVNVVAADRYHPQPYAGRLTLLRCSERSITDGDDPLLGWEKLAAGGLEVYDLPGHHLNITMEPRVRVLGETLRACLEKDPAREKSAAESSHG